MNIIVLIKEIPDLNVGIDVDPKHNLADPDDLVYIPNPCDLVSLCLARTWVQHHKTGSVTALLLGPERASKVLKKSLEYGANRAIHLLWEKAAELESHQVAFLLAEAINRMNLSYDLIFAGHDNTGGSLASGQIGAQVGSHLALRQISQVIRIYPDQNQNTFMVEACLDLGDRIKLKCSPPMLLTIHPDAEQVAYPSLVEFLDTPGEVEEVTPEDLDLNPLGTEKRIEFLGTSSPRPRPKKVFTPDSSLPAAERMRLIMGGGLQKKQSEFVEGNPEKLAKTILDHLIQRRIVRF